MVVSLILCPDFECFLLFCPHSCLCLPQTFWILQYSHPPLSLLDLLGLLLGACNDRKINICSNLKVYPPPSHLNAQLCSACWLTLHCKVK